MAIKPTIADLSLQLASALIRIQTLEEALAVNTSRLEFTRKQLARIERRERARRGKLRSWAQKIATKVANMSKIPDAKPAASVPAKAKRDVSQYPTVSYEEFEGLGLKSYPSNAIPGQDFVCWCYIDKVEHRILPKQPAYADDFE